MAARRGGAAWVWWMGGLLAFLAVWNGLASLNPVYSAERMLWPMEFAVRRIVQDPDSIPQAEVGRTLENLRKVIGKYPGTITASRAQLLMVQVHLARKEYAQSRGAAEKVIAEYPNLAVQVIDAYKAIAASYLAEEAWKKALDAYRILLQKQTFHPRVQDVPMRMVGVAREKMPDAGDSVLKEAIRHYRTVTERSGRSDLSTFLANQRLAGCYLLSARWEEAAKIYETLAMAYPFRPEVVAWVRNVDELGKKRLNDPSRGGALAQKFAQAHPGRRQLVERWLTLAVQK